MAGYKSTQVRKPTDETEFEKNCVVLFKELLNDPNVSRVGTRGQRQNGVDIKGHRDGDPNWLVGVQCKLKTGISKLTKKEVDHEVKQALAFRPPLQEYFIVTTSKNDTKLLQRAATLMQEQAAAGRRIQIEVWGWDTLEEKINQHQAAKHAFDPGFSPTIAVQDRKLDALIEGQLRQPTKDDFVALASKLDKERTEFSAQLPQRIADRELREELAKALRRRGFALSDTPEELASLAARAAGGDLASGSQLIKAEVFERAARANAVPETQLIAIEFRNRAAAADPSRDLLVVDALLKEANRDPNGALRHLKSRNDIEARSALFSVLMRHKGPQAALMWARTENLGAEDFTPPSALNLVLRMVESADYDAALAFVLQIPSAYFDEIAALLLLRAQLRLASILPQDQKAALFQGLPINPRQLQFASGPRADDIAKAALSDIQALLAQTKDLGVTYLDDYLMEFALWLRLEIVDEHASAREQLAVEIADPELTLRRVRLALAYDIPFDATALQRNLVQRKEIGGWNADERFAAFLIAFQSGSPRNIAEFFEAHRDDLFAQSELAPVHLAAIEIEATARAGRIDDARGLLRQYEGTYLNDEQVKDLEEQIAAIERDDELDTHRRRYEVSGGLSELRVLVGGLRVRGDVALLATYSPALARATRTRGDFDTAIKSLYHAHRDADLIDLANDLPDLTKLDLEYESIRGWALYRLGRVVEARDIARKLFASRSDNNDRELAINTAIETGDWGYLQGILAHEVARVDALSANDCTRLARLGFEIGSPYVNQFRDAALLKAPDDPSVHLMAYMLATERGEEDHGSQAHEWFQKAVALSGPTGPVQAVSLRELIDHTSGWRERTEKVDRAFRHAEVPAFMAAQAVRRRLLDLTLGQASRNLDTQDSRLSFPVFAFSGAKPGVELNVGETAAFDITALITLEYLGLLDEALNHFGRVTISPRTLTLLFAERQFIRVQQPSRVAKARRIQALIAAGRLKVVVRRDSQRTAANKEIGEEMATLLDTAATDGGLVVRSAPVIKLGSYLDETADMSRYAAVLTDTHAVLALLSAEGKIEEGTRRSAEAYLNHVDKRWTAAPTINLSTRLYLDDLTVTYLDYLGLLDALTGFVGNVFIHEDVSDQIQQTLRYSEHTGELLGAIEHIRGALAAGIQSGRVVFSSRQSSAESADEKGEDPGDFSPTLDLLSDLAGCDVAIVDDRSLNKLAKWSDKAGRTVPCANTLDILTALRKSGQIEETSYWAKRHKLRIGGFYAVALEADELIFWLEAAPRSNGTARETPELRAIRESVALPQINDAFVAQEEHWLAGVRFAIYQAIRRTWMETKDYGVAEANANWLRSINPDPRGWCVEFNNEATWAAAQQQAANQIAILMVFTSAKKDRRRRYFEWLDANVIAPFRKTNPETWNAALDFLKSYVAQLWEVNEDKSERDREVLTALLLNPLPSLDRMKLFLDEAFCKKLGIKPQFWYPLGGDQSVEAVSLHGALRGAIAGRKTAILALKDGRSARVKLGTQKDGSATFVLDKKGFAFTNADLLSAERKIRLKGLDRVFRAKPLLAGEENKWRDVAGRAFTDREYDDLMTTLGETPEAFSFELGKPHDLSSESMMPNSPEYYGRLLAPLGDSTDLPSFICGELKRARESLFERNPARALRRIAFSALWEPLIPFDLLAALKPADVSPLLIAEDPFSLLFGFELCRHLLQNDLAYSDLGTSFLERLFGNKDVNHRRCEVFTACAVVATIGFRQAAQAAGAPVYQARLAALTHAGVLTDGLSRLPDSSGFLRWSINHFYPFYIWHGVVDRREAMRWDPVWISPDHIFAELVGRVGKGLDMLPPEHRPAPWVAIIQSAIGQLSESTNPLAAMFPGPFDDFGEAQPRVVWHEVVAEIEEQLARAANPAEAQGLAAMAFALAPSERAVGNVLRIFSSNSEEPVTDAKGELPYLQVAAHFALAARSESIAEVVVQRCFVLMHATPDMATDLFAIIATSSAIHGNTRKYYTAIGEYAARSCFLIDDAESLGNLAAVFDVLIERDERLSPVLAKAHSIARTKRGRI
ncbi:hypothetical protein FJ987_17275 [Mesorhizobium sp. CU2]|uniref:HTH domain-containing protein n=1 Tax=unclassified Mesorhizobium TaxID=325217 RepID=UPI001128C3C8|nr:MULTISPECIES: hypothetical protein [unclassified Mesorhizobium]TPN83201.1 hypothetical protein FJ988_14430 [Mesorhizobium sp. CU3]TPO12213.1 hypothetical protein FJ987_17275 [Mesorhizobium sp. CU2]